MVDTQRRIRPDVPIPFELGGISILPGERGDLRVKISELYTAVPVMIPLTIVNGATPGPRLFVTAAIHGNETNGIEMVRRIRADVDPLKLRGVLLLVAIANPIAFMNMNRDLPDGRDLNRFFPGRAEGSMASHIAAALFNKVIKRADFGIDLHTAAAGRTNLPHVRADLGFPQVRRLASAFGCEVVFDMPGEKGMLRHAATKLGIPTIVYEAGEPMKFQQNLIARGVTGIRNVMAELGMYEFARESPPFQVIIDDHKWIRAQRGGILMMQIKPGDLVEKGDVLAVHTKPFGAEVMRLKAPYSGLVVGTTTMPMAIPGAAVCHLVKLGSRLRPMKAMLKRKALVFE
jgi:predicted deacylase